MNVKQAIKQRRSYRALQPVEITDELISELASAAQLAPSCFNNQPWRFVYVYEQELLAQVQSEAISEGNKWAHNASMIIAVLSSKELDCVVRGKEYYMFDSGLAVGQMMLRATELGLVAHPIAGFDDDRVRELLSIPDEMAVITLLVVGQKSKDTSSLSEKQITSEEDRPERKQLEKIVFHNKFTG